MKMKIARKFIRKSKDSKVGGRPKTLRFTIGEINSLAGFNARAQVKPLKAMETEDNSLICEETLPFAEGFSAFAVKQRVLLDLFDSTVESAGERDEGIAVFERVEKEYGFAWDYVSQFPKSELNAQMRMILVDWMTEISAEFGLKRETLYEAVNLLDRFLARKSPLARKTELQRIGMTAVHIAAKNSEVHPPKLIELAATAKHRWTSEEIIEMELHILQVLGWKIHPISLNSWLGLAMTEWDQHVRSNPHNLKEFSENTAFFSFLAPQADSFINYRIVTGYLDAAVLDHRVMAFGGKAVVAALMYSLLSSNSESFAGENTRFQGNSFDFSFNEFLARKFGISIEELCPVLDFLGKLKALPLNFGLMREGFENNGKNRFEEKYRESLGIQVHNREALDFMRSLGK